METIPVSIRVYENGQYVLWYRTDILATRENTDSLMIGIYRATAKIVDNRWLITVIEIWDNDNDNMLYSFDYFKES